MKKQALFQIKKKDLTASTHFSLQKSIISKLKEDSKKYNISVSKIVNTILTEYYKDK